MTPTDTLIRVVVAELEFWRPIFDARADQLDSVRIIVNLDRQQRPRSIVVSPEMRQDLTQSGRSVARM